MALESILTNANTIKEKNDVSISILDITLIVKKTAPGQLSFQFAKFR